MVAMNTTAPTEPAPAPQRRMPLNEKLSWTFAGITAASGGAVFMCDQMANTTDKRTQQILGAVLAFWIVLIIRTVMTYVWGLGMPKAAEPAAAPAVTSAEDEGEEGVGGRRRRARARRDD